MAIRYNSITPGRKVLKSFLAKIVFWFLGRGVQASSVLDPVIKKEIEGWDDSVTIILKVNDYGPQMVLKKKNGKLRFISAKKVDQPDLAIYFKNIEAAVLILTGQLGIAQAFAEHRFTVKGDIGFSMSFVRILYVVESYLFPKFITNKILKQTPAKGSNSFKIYLGTIIGLR